AFDGLAYSGSATVSLSIAAPTTQHAPVASADAYAVDQNLSMTIAAPGVLANDTDTDGDTLTASLVSGPSHGSLTFTSNGSFTYTPQAGFSGTDNFTYKVFDGQFSSSAGVNLTVNAVNHDPVVVNDTATMIED